MVISTADTRKRFEVLSVREAFDRVTVPAGQDAMWEEPKAPSALQVNEHPDNMHAAKPRHCVGWYFVRGRNPEAVLLSALKKKMKNGN